MSECVYHDVYVCGWGHTHNSEHGVSIEHDMFVAICGGMMSSEGVLTICGYVEDTV